MLGQLLLRSWGRVLREKNVSTLPSLPRQFLNTIGLPIRSLYESLPYIQDIYRLGNIFFVAGWNLLQITMSVRRLFLHRLLSKRLFIHLMFDGCRKSNFILWTMLMLLFISIMLFVMLEGWSFVAYCNLLLCCCCGCLCLSG